MDKILSNGNKILTDSERRRMLKKAETAYKKFLETLDFDIDNDQQLFGTPERVARMYVNELFAGCYTEEPKMTVFDNTEEYDEMVVLGPISIKSTCSHHIIPFIGEAYIAYIPDKKVVGISKLARITKWFMRRPQIQEELTKQISNYVQEHLNPLGVGVYIKAQHLCMIARGVEEYNSSMVTSSLRGVFKESEATRKEFFDIIKGD